MKVIGKDTVVALRFVMSNDRGEVLEDRMQGEPVEYLHGAAGVAGGIDSVLQTHLEGLIAGDRKTVFLHKGEGGIEDELVLDVLIDSVRPATKEEIAVGHPENVRRNGGLQVLVLSGWLGSGKTTAIREACRLLIERGRRVAVITNDQGSKLVDGGFFRGLGIASRQVINGCFCCHYNELDRHIASLQTTEQPEIIFAESVGSCTDIVATVLRPLLAYRKDLRPAFSVFADGRLLMDLLSGAGPALDEDVRYIYFKQLEEAGLIVVSQIDLMDTGRLVELQTKMGERFSGKQVLYQDSFDPAHIDRWLGAMDGMDVRGLSSPEIDYAVYGAGEAKLAWLDQELSIHRGDAGAEMIGRTLVDTLYRSILAEGWPIGHLKFLLNDSIKISMTASGVEGGLVSSEKEASGESVKLLINARVQAEPQQLERLVRGVAERTADLFHCSVETKDLHSFQPGFPTPTHRLTEAV